MTPAYFTDEFGQTHAWAIWRNHYLIGIGSDKAEADKRFAEALKVAQR